MEFDLYEYIELQNISTTQTIDLSTIEFNNGIRFQFAGSAVTTLGPEEFVLVVRDIATFTSRYGTEAADGTPYQIAGEFEGGINNGGDAIRLIDSFNTIIHEFRYEDGNDELTEPDWHPLTDGSGPSLSTLNTEGDYSLGTNWRTSGIDNGTPGRLDPIDGALPGDATYDGKVDLGDLAKLATNFGRSILDDPELDVRWQHGDFTGDGIIDLGDLAKLATFFGQTQIFNGGGSAASEHFNSLSHHDQTTDALTINTTARIIPQNNDTHRWNHIGDLLNDNDEVHII